MTDLATLFDNTTSEVSRGLDPVEWAENEIAAACRRHPLKVHTLWHSFMLVRPNLVDRRMEQEFVLRAHVRELLERVAAGEDTRPATDVEMVLAISDMNQVTPLNTSASTLYLRLWARAFPHHPEIFEHRELAAYEHVGGSGADTLEAELRHKLARPTRRFDPETITCMGKHHGVPAPTCPYQSASKAA